MRKLLTLISLMTLFGSLTYLAPAEARDIEYRMAVFALRHGIRHPTPAPPDLALYAQNRNWSSWYTTQLGCLTANGVRVEEKLGAFYRDVLIRQGLIAPSDQCPTDHSYYIRADSFQRTWWSARGMTDGLYPKCDARIYAINGFVYAQQVPTQNGDLVCTSENDPLFFPLEIPTNPPQMNSSQALLAASATVGAQGNVSSVTTGLLTDAYRSQISVLQSATDCCQPQACATLATTGQQCTLNQLADTLVASGSAVTLNGPVSVGGVLAATFLMAYQDGLPMQDVAFGQLSMDQLNPTYALNNTAFSVMYSTPYVAQAQTSTLMNQILLSLQQRAEARKKPNAITLPSNKVVMFMGHDDNLYGLGALMKVSWINKGYQSNQTPAGSGFVFTLIRERDTGRHFVKTEFVAQSPDQQRHMETLTLDNPPSLVPLQIPGCDSPLDLPYYCPLDKFNHLIRKGMSSKYLIKVPSLR